MVNYLRFYDYFTTTFSSEAEPSTEDTEDLPPCKSNQGSRCNTLRRRKNTRNSKKRRKSKHIL